MTRQYPLPLPHREAMEADDFMVTASNREAIAWIDKWPEWPAHCLVIYGPSGAGKTHLSHVWQAKSRAKMVPANTLAAEDPGALIVSNRMIAIDDAEAVATKAAHEKNLLHLYNLIREAKGFLLLTAQHAPAQWRLALPDLRSRLTSIPAIALGAPDDALLSALLIKQFRDRQIDISMDVVDFLLPRVTRTPGTIRDMVTALDRASLAEGRGITIALAKRILDAMNAS